MKSLMDKYISKFEVEDQKKMQQLRGIVQKYISSEEGMSYSMPSFKVNSGIVCCFAMYKNHLGFYPYSGNVTKLFKNELSGYKWSDGAVQFPKDKPLPKALITKLLEARLQELANTNLYYYKCPRPLGYLEIKLDTKSKIKTAIFVDKKGSGKVLPENIEKALGDYFEKRKSLAHSLLSKDIMGTDFQKSVWHTISNTKIGQTTTYSDIARGLKQEKAVRAVGTACGKNPVALFIPCHRVIGLNGKIDTGFAWGIVRKKWLLNFEK